MDRQELADLISEDRLRLKNLYNKYRAPFLNFGRKYGLDEYALSDVYQEAFIALYKRGVNGKLNKVSSSMQTYLFGIGKFMIYDVLKKNSRQRSLENLLRNTEEEEEEEVVQTSATLTNEQKLLQNSFKKLGEKCQQVLTLFYYRGLTIEEIVAHSGYENANTVKAQKSRCLRSLKQLVKPEDYG
ncbi:RNA polymerase sigma factor [Flavobacteriaceae bacterium M23B6Z8]